MQGASGVAGQLWLRLGLKATKSEHPADPIPTAVVEDELNLEDLLRGVACTPLEEAIELYYKSLPVNLQVATRHFALSFPSGLLIGTGCSGGCTHVAVTRLVIERGTDLSRLSVLNSRRS